MWRLIAMCALVSKLVAGVRDSRDWDYLPVDFEYDPNPTGCIRALRALPASEVSIASASSSDAAPIAASSDPAGFSVDIGNYDLCQRQSGVLMHCLAGSLKLGDPFVSLTPFSGVCVPPACGPRELESHDVSAFLTGEQHLDLSRHAYYRLLAESLALARATNTSFSCGAHRASMTTDRYLFLTSFLLLLVAVVGSTLYQMVATNGAARVERAKEGQGGGGSGVVDDRQTTQAQAQPQALERGQGQGRGQIDAFVSAFSLINSVPFIFSGREGGGGAASVDARGAARGVRGPEPRVGVGTEDGREKENADRFAALDGLRALSILWIVLGHTLTVSTSIGLTNPATVLPPTGFLRDSGAQLLLSSRFAVDTFLFISGFLVVGSLLKRLRPVDKGAGWAGQGVVLGLGLGLGKGKGGGQRQGLLLNGLGLGSGSGTGVVGYQSINCGEEEEEGEEEGGRYRGRLSDVDRDREWGQTLAPESTSATATATAMGAAMGSGKGPGPASSSTRPPSTPAQPPPPSWMTWLPQFYLHRLLRLWPPYIFALLLWWKIGVLMGYGPFWHRWMSFSHRCDLYWWTNVLFVNNFVPYDSSEGDECFYVSWYLATDMQCYLIAPLFVAAYLYRPELGLFAVLATSLASSVAGFTAAWDHRWSAHSFDGANVTRYSHLFYTKPQYRFPSYAAGMASAMLWHIKGVWEREREQERRAEAAAKAVTGSEAEDGAEAGTVKVAAHTQDSPPVSFTLPPKVANALLLFACTTLLAVTLWGTSAYQQRPCGYSEATAVGRGCGSDWSRGAMAMYCAWSKPLWAWSIAIIVLLSGMGQGGHIATFLQHPLWGPLSRLSFSVYLLHITVIEVWTLGRAQKLRYAHFDFAMQYLAVVLASVLGALVLTVVVEAPAARLSKAIERRFFSGCD